MEEEFYFSYKGNKRNEINHIKYILKSISFKSFVEPFGGTCSLSRYIYQNFENINIHISDINEDLVFFCNNFYKYSNDVIQKCKEKINNINNKEEYKSEYYKCISRFDKNNIIDYLSCILFENTAYKISKGRYYLNSAPKYIKLSKNKDKINYFFEQNEYILCEYIDVFKKYSQDENALIFLDPPYVNSDASDYDTNNKKQYSNMWEDIYNLFKNSKCKIIMIVNNNFFMRKVFDEWFHSSYEKKYCCQNSKKQTHNVFVKLN